MVSAILTCWLSLGFPAYGLGLQCGWWLMVLGLHCGCKNFRIPEWKSL
ncbi:unnamed protein product [Prunus brigantina]